MRQFLDMVRENRSCVKKLRQGFMMPIRTLLLARSVMADEILNVSLMAPRQEVYLETNTKNIMSVDIPKFEYKTKTPDENDIYPYGYAFTSSDLDDAVKACKIYYRIC